MMDIKQILEIKCITKEDDLCLGNIPVSEESVKDIMDFEETEYTLDLKKQIQSIQDVMLNRQKKRKV